MNKSQLKSFIKKVIVNEQIEKDNKLDSLWYKADQNYELIVNAAQRKVSLKLGDVEDHENEKIISGMESFIGKNAPLNRIWYVDERNSSYDIVDDIVTTLSPKATKIISYKNDEGYKGAVILKKYKTNDQKYQIVARILEGPFETSEWFITKLIYPTHP